MTTKYFNVKHGLTTGEIKLDATSGNIDAVNLTVTTLMTVGNISGDGHLLTDLNGANVTGQVGNALVAGTVYTGAQPNITSVGTLTSLSITGNVTAGNASLGNLATASYFSGNGSLLSAINGGNVNGQVASAADADQANYANIANSVAGGNVTGQVANALVAGTVYTAAQPAITSVGTLTSVTVSGLATVGNLTTAGNVTAGYFSGDGSLLTNITGANVNGQVANALVSGTVYSAAQPNITSTGTLASLTVSGSTTLQSGASVTGAVTATGNISSGGNLIAVSGIYGTLQTASQPQITSVGTLNGLTVGDDVSVTGNISASGNITTQNLIGNLYGDVYGNFAGTVQAPGSNTQVLFNDGGNISADSGMTYNKTTDTLTVVDLSVTDITASGDVSGDTLTGNLTTAIQSNITQVGTLADLDVTADATIGGNITINGDLANIQANVYTNGTLHVDNSTNATDLTTAALVVDGGASFAQDVRIGGTLYVDEISNVTYSQLEISAPLVYFTSSDPANYTYDIGFYSHFGSGATYQHTGFVRDNTDNAWYLFSNAAEPTGGNIDFANDVNIVYDDIVVGGLTASAINLNGELNSGNITATGNINATLFIGSGANLTNINGANVSQVANANYASYAGQVVDASQGNITSVGTLNGLTVTGNVSTTGIKTDNYYYANGAPLDMQQPGGSNTYVQFNDADDLGGSSNFTFNKTTNVLGLTGTLDVIGEGYFTGDVTAGNVAVTGDVSGTTLTGSLTTAAQGNITSVGTLTSVTVSGLATVGNLTTAGNVTAVGFYGTVQTASQPQITSVGTLTSLTVSGNVNAGNVSTSGDVTGATLTGSLTTASQSNITAVGTLAGLTVDGTTNLGPVGNVTITGGTSGYFLKTNGSGTLTWDAVPTGTQLANGTSNITIPVSSSNVVVGVGGVSSTVVFTTTGVNVAGYLTVVGDITGGNVSTSGNVDAAYFNGDGSALTSITGANVTGYVADADHATIADVAYVAYSIDGANVVGAVDEAVDATNAVNVTGNAQPNITSVGTLTTLAVSTNANVGNVRVSGAVITNRTGVEVTSGTVVDQFAAGTYRTAKYVLTAQGDDGYQSAEALIVHTGSVAYVTIYGSICSNVTADIVEFSTSFNGTSGNVELLATAGGANVTVNVLASYLPD